MADALLEADAPHPGFQMQSHHDGEGWTPMEAGVAPKVWRPRPTREDAVHKCLEWTGLVCIPAMRVVDLADGSVLWQDRWDGGGDAHLERIVPGWAVPLYDAARTELAQVDEVLGRAIDEFVPDMSTAADPADDGALFSLEEVSGG